MSTITIQVDNNQPIKSISVEFYNNGEVSNVVSNPINNNNYNSGMTSGCVGNFDQDDKPKDSIHYNQFSKVNEDDYINNEKDYGKDEEVVSTIIPDVSNREVKVASTMQEEV